MPRPKKSDNDNKDKIKTNRYICTCCGKEQNKTDEFYRSNSYIYKHNQRMTICKTCVIQLYKELIDKYQNGKEALFYFCRMLDIYYDGSLYPSVEQQAINTNSTIAQTYLQKINSLPQYNSLTFSDSPNLHTTPTTTPTGERISIEESDIDRRNKEDVIRMVGYDPFEFENPLDKKNLYNMLVDMLDESTLEDSFKLPIVIEITKSFNQIDKINQALAIITSDVNQMNSSLGGVKSLIDAKKNMYSSILSMAKDNGISVNHATTKSKGAGTLSGIMKLMQEKGFMEVEVNLFDIETSAGMRQVADISNQSILKQLNFDENDYVAMLTEQREMIQKLDDKNIKLEEELRLLKLKLKN